jgi:hypothetical protein
MCFGHGKQCLGSGKPDRQWPWIEGQNRHYSDYGAQYDQSDRYFQALPDEILVSVAAKVCLFTLKR